MSFAINETPRTFIKFKLFKLLQPISLKISATENGVLEIHPSGSPSFVIKNKETLSISIITEGLEIVGPDNNTLRCKTLGITPSDENLMMIRCPKINERLYEGLLNISNKDNKLDIILSTDLESAVEQILMSEMEHIKYKNALVAFSIVIRTYLSFNRGRHISEGYDFCDTTHCQVFKGWNSSSFESTKKKRDDIHRILKDTRNLVIKYNGKIIEAYYTACCGGYTATPEMIWGGDNYSYPYRQTQCPFCNSSPYYRWTREVLKKEFASFFGLDEFSLEISTITASELGGYVKSVIIKDKNNRFEFSSMDFRQEMARRFGWGIVLSHAFEVECQQEKIIFKGKGFGHGIGFCQHAAIAMDLLGYHWNRIIDFFFPLVAVEKISTK